VAADQATVLLAAYTEEDIASYVRSGEPMDKAGAYGIQSLPAHMIDRIEGDKEAIIGLSTATVRNLLAKAEFS
jgi:septum formation protein